MIKRTIEVSSRSRLSIRLGQLKLSREDGAEVSIPANEVGLLILDNPAVSYTHQTITELMHAGAAIVFCSSNHMPVSLMVPLEGNCIQTERLRAQVELSKPKSKQLWKQVIVQKLKNQAENLKYFAYTSTSENNMLRVAERIDKLAAKVKTGDIENAEGQGARLYFQAMFGSSFHRDRDGEPPNNMLNYGYIVFRACVARVLVGVGFHPSIGIFHRNRYNPFCLADDFLEIVRPLVDREVKHIFDEGYLEISPATKPRLLSLLTSTTIFRGKRSPISVALEKMASSIVKYYTGEIQTVDFPVLFE